MKKLIVIALLFASSNIKTNTYPTSSIKKYITNKYINLSCAAFCGIIASWDLIKSQKLIAAGVRMPLLVHVCIGQVGLALAANVFSHSWTTRVVDKKDTLDQNLVFNAFENAFN